MHHVTFRKFSGKKMLMEHNVILETVTAPISELTVPALTLKALASVHNLHTRFLFLYLSDPVDSANRALDPIGAYVDETSRKYRRSSGVRF